MMRAGVGAVLVLILLQGCKEAYDADSGGYYVPSLLPVDSTAEAPKIRVSIGIETGEFSLSWGSVPGATGYELEESSVGLGVKVHWMGMERRYYVGRIPAGRQYTYRVRSLRILDVTRWSEPVTLP